MITKGLAIEYAARLEDSLRTHLGAVGGGLGQLTMSVKGRLPVLVFVGLREVGRTRNRISHHGDFREEDIPDYYVDLCERLLEELKQPMSVPVKSEDARVSIPLQATVINRMAIQEYLAYTHRVYPISVPITRPLTLRKIAAAIQVSLDCIREIIKQHHLSVLLHEDDEIDHSTYIILYRAFRFCFRLEEEKSSLETNLSFTPGAKPYFTNPVPISRPVTPQKLAAALDVPLLHVLDLLKRRRRELSGDDEISEYMLSYLCDFYRAALQFEKEEPIR